MMRTLHRRLAWIAGAVAVLWAATGFLHPIMSWTAPRPAIQAPPTQSLRTEGLVAPGPLLAGARWSDAAHVRLIAVDGAEHWLALRAGGEGRAFDARTGAEAPNAEQRHAIALARAYAGLPTANVVSVERVTRFSLDYPSINRLLPVWAVRFDTPDALTLYVDTGADRLAAVVNNPRRVMLFVFQNVHTLQFLAPVEPLRRALILALVGSLLVTALIGARMALTARGKGRRAVHLWLGVLAAPFVLSFAGSGLFHLFASEDLTATRPPQLEPAALGAPPRIAGAPVSDLRAINIGGETLWRVEAADAGLYFAPDGAWRADLDDLSAARIIAGAPPNAAVSLIATFNKEYGFANKRLPVLRVETDNRPIFVAPREALVAARAPSGLANADAWAFDTIHKWSFANPLGRMTRDVLMMIAVAFIAAAALLGLTLLPKRKRT